jgi:hypothetical protein
MPRRLELTIPLDQPRDPIGWEYVGDAMEALFRESGIEPLRGRTKLGFRWLVTDEHLDPPATWRWLARLSGNRGLRILNTSTRPDRGSSVTITESSLRKTEFGQKPNLTLTIEEI